MNDNEQLRTIGSAVLQKAVDDLFSNNKNERESAKRYFSKIDSGLKYWCMVLNLNEEDLINRVKTDYFTAASAKVYLMQYKNLDTKIKRLTQNADFEREKAQSISPCRGDGIHSSGISDKILNGIEKCDELLTKISVLKLQQQEVKENITNTLKKMKNAKHSKILYLKYIKFLSWSKVAATIYKTEKCIPQEKKINASPEYITEISTNEHRRALREFYKNIS